jgi:3-dehydroquinate synthase
MDLAVTSRTILGKGIRALRKEGRIPAELVERHRAVLTSVGLPTSYRGDRWPALRAAMSIDKKSRGAKLRLVVLDDLGKPVITAEPDEELLAEAYRRVSA